MHNDVITWEWRHTLIYIYAKGGGGRVEVGGGGGGGNVKLYFSIGVDHYHIR